MERGNIITDVFISETLLQLVNKSLHFLNAVIKKSTCKRCKHPEQGTRPCIYESEKPKMLHVHRSLVCFSPQDIQA